MIPILGGMGSRCKKRKGGRSWNLGPARVNIAPHVDGYLVVIVNIPLREPLQKNTCSRRRGDPSAL